MRPVPEPTVDPPLLGIRVLVVDDELLIRWSLREALADRGFSVIEARDGGEAVQSLNDGPPPDVVLLDYRLPDVDGLVLLPKIRRLLPNGKVLLMTAFRSPEVSMSALDLGAYCIVAKPFDVDEIASLIRQAHGAAASGGSHG